MADVTETRAVVRGLDGDFVLIEAEQGGCGRCHEEGGCGGQHLTQMLCATAKTWRLENPGGLKVGDTVTVAIAAGQVRRTANLAYGLPIFGLLAGAIAGMQIAGDPGAMIGGLAGLWLAWWAVRRQTRNTTSYQPKITLRSSNG